MSCNDTLARSFKALSHPRRVMLFRLLADRPETGDSLDRLWRAARLQRSSLIHHLREMERCGLIRRQRHGLEVAYRLTPGALTQALEDAGEIARVSRHRPRRVA